MALDLIKPIGYLMRIFLLVPNLLLNTNFGTKWITHVIFFYWFYFFFQKEKLFYSKMLLKYIKELD